MPTRTSGITLTIVAVVLAGGGLIVGNIPYSTEGFQACPSFFGSLGGQTIDTAFIDGLSDGACTSYAHMMAAYTIGLIIAAVIVVIIGIGLRVYSQARQPAMILVNRLAPPAIGGDSAVGTSWPAGWYADWEVPGRMRWWNGVAWTTHVHMPPHLG